MTAELFQVQLLEFPISTKKNCTNIQSRDVYISPFHRHNHVFMFDGPLIKSNINSTGKIIFLNVYSNTMYNRKN